VYLALRMHHHYIIVHFTKYHYSIIGITGSTGITDIKFVENNMPKSLCCDTTDKSELLRL